VGADPTAKFVALSCADDYYESLDMATAMHPQSLLCYEMYDRLLTREHGAPLRLNVPTKIGYKQAKYIIGLKLQHVLDHVGYWEDQGTFRSAACPAEFLRAIEHRSAVPALRNINRARRSRVFTKAQV
jgi:DMSO/TMAO reductase YedYZ molybdopterin-dependent catalytic subunit